MNWRKTLLPAIGIIIVLYSLIFLAVELAVHMSAQEAAPVHVVNKGDK